jgi:hypothetical protein
VNQRLGSSIGLSMGRCVSSAHNTRDLKYRVIINQSIYLSRKAASSNNAGGITAEQRIRRTDDHTVPPSSGVVAHHILLQAAELSE